MVAGPRISSIIPAAMLAVSRPGQMRPPKSVCFLANSSLMKIGSFRPARQVKLTMSVSVTVRP